MLLLAGRLPQRCVITLQSAGKLRGLGKEPRAAAVLVLDAGNPTASCSAQGSVPQVIMRIQGCRSRVLVSSALPKPTKGDFWARTR